MNKTIKTISTLAGLGIAIAMLAGCAPTTPETTSAPTTAPTATPSAPAPTATGATETITTTDLYGNEVELSYVPITGTPASATASTVGLPADAKAITYTRSADGTYSASRCEDGWNEVSILSGSPTEANPLGHIVAAGCIPLEELIEIEKDSGTYYDPSDLEELANQ